MTLTVLNTKNVLKQDNIFKYLRETLMSLYISITSKEYLGKESPPVTIRKIYIKIK